MQRGSSLKSWQSGGEAWLVPLALLLLAALAYGLLIPWLGYYWDEWFFVWAGKALGPQALQTALQADRPWQGWLYALSIQVLGFAPLPWHATALGLRWLSAVAAWWLLRALWPRRTVEPAAVAALFLVYPGFAQQPLGFMYGLTAFLPLAAWLLSAGALLWALRGRRFWLLLGVSLAAAGPGLFVVEFYAGLEFFRVLLVWAVLGERIAAWRPRLRQTLAYCLPYLGLLVLNALWHLLTLDRTTPETKNLGGYLRDLLANPAGELARRAGYVLSDLAATTFTAWVRTVQPEAFALAGRAGWLAWGVAAVSAGLAVAVLLRPGQRAAAPGRAPAWARQAVGLGFAAIICAQLPYWLTNRPISWVDAADRYLLAAMLGAVLVTAGVLALAIPARRAFVLAIGLCVGLAAGFHVRNANEYRLDWERTRDLTWQLSWRAPGLARGTTLLLYRRPWSLPQPKDYSLALPVNFVYQGGAASPEMAYWVFSDAPPYRWVWFRPQVPGAQLDRQLRTLNFAGDAAQVVVAVQAEQGCLQVLAAGQAGAAHLPALLQLAQPYSDLSQIEAQGAAVPPEDIFGPEPAHGWCYLYEKAELARQNRNWTEVTRLGEAALALYRTGEGPEDRIEWLPFLEGFVRAARYAEAERVVGFLSFEADPLLAQYLVPEQVTGNQAVGCALLGRVEAEETPTPDAAAFLRQARAKLRCGAGQQ